MNYCPFCGRLLANLGDLLGWSTEYQCRKCKVNFLHKPPTDEKVCKFGSIMTKPSPWLADTMRPPQRPQKNK